VFSGIGEFSIHKEFVSSKIAGPVATLNNPALDRILDFCAESGLLVILHNDINMPFPKPDQENWDAAQMKELLKRHPATTIIWAHCGVGRIVRPVKDHLAMLTRALSDPAFDHIYIDISWSEVAKYVTETPETITNTAAVINQYPDRFLMGTDEMAPATQTAYLRILDMYKPLLDKLTPGTKKKLLKENYERLFNAARLKVRAWEKQQLKYKV
jgi:predicted TIM-barrel fold metal-dependent hydrolase